MRYDRPVSELLDECARTLPEPFTRQDVLRWFRENYPGLRPGTVAAHIFGPNDSDAPSHDFYRFGGRPPMLERVGRGLYRRARGRPRQPELFDGPSHLLAAPPTGTLAHPTGDVLLVGCVKSQRPGPARARDLFTSALFARRRRYAEAAGRPWFVISSRWGLVAPDEVIAPYDVLLGDMPASYRHAWAEFVVAQLAGRVRLPGAVVEVHAGDHDVDALRTAVERAGATLIDPVDAHSIAAALAWYDAHHPDAGGDEAAAGEVAAGEVAAGEVAAGEA
jgi:hypothetical protein